LRQTAVNNREVAVLPTAGKEERVFGDGICRGPIPAPTGQRLVDAGIVQLGPGQLLERLQPAEVSEELQNRPFTFEAVDLSASPADSGDKINITASILHHEQVRFNKDPADSDPCKPLGR
jgi:hypothetical protein